MGRARCEAGGCRTGSGTKREREVKRDETTNGGELRLSVNRVESNRGRRDISVIREGEPTAAARAAAAAAVTVNE